MIERHYSHVRSDVEMSPTKEVLFNPVVVPILEEAVEGILTFHPGKKFEAEEDDGPDQLDGDEDIGKAVLS